MGDDDSTGRSRAVPAPAGRGGVPLPTSPSEERSGLTRAGHNVVLGSLAPTEHEALFAIFDDVVSTGDGYPQAPPLTAAVFEATWITAVTLTVVARVAGAVVGAYYLKPNFPGRAAHIANAGYVVDSAHRRHGIGRLLVEDSLWRAPLLGFDAMQFNLVFATNPARSLYEELGWRPIGRLPAAVDGEDALIYWRSL